MMQKISLLDCTLRDGGYVNDWRFGRENIISIFERLRDAGTDIIETGFLDERRPFDAERSILPDTESFDRVYEGTEKKGAMAVAMIDYGTCGIENLRPASGSFLDGIRVIFKKHNMRDALGFCGKVKALGYRVFVQLVSITSYEDRDFRELISLVNEVCPYCVSIVDTYGLSHPEDIVRYARILEQGVSEGIRIGFHAHNNFQLGYANSLAFLEAVGNHDVIVDGTLFGMGKSAGNAPLELLAMRLNERYGGNYDTSSMIEAIDESIMSIYEKYPWGYKTFFYLCAKNRCHPNYLTYFEGKKDLSDSKIDGLLGRIGPEEKKLLYDKEVAELIYEQYLNGDGSDIRSRIAFAKEIQNRKALLIGPGKNIALQQKKVQRFIEQEKPYIISVNYIPDAISPDCVFVTNSKRYHDMTLSLRQREIKILATTNVEARGGSFSFVIHRAPLLEKNENIIDNSFLMLLKFLKSIDVTEVCCAGFDGYSDREDNYVNPVMEYNFVKQEARHLNAHIKEAIAFLRQSMHIEFITYSAYDVEEDINGASI